MNRAEHNLSSLRQCRQQWYLMSASNSGRKSSEIKEDLLYTLKNQLICVECGERHPATLDFHHSDPSLKDFAISDAKSKDLIKILNEAEKCEILCSNCHRKHHAKERYSKLHKIPGIRRKRLSTMRRTSHYKFSSKKTTKSNSIFRQTLSKL